MPNIRRYQLERCFYILWFCRIAANFCQYNINSIQSGPDCAELRYYLISSRHNQKCILCAHLLWLSYICLVHEYMKFVELNSSSRRLVLQPHVKEARGITVLPFNTTPPNHHLCRVSPQPRRCGHGRLKMRFPFSLWQQVAKSTTYKLRVATVMVSAVVAFGPLWSNNHLSIGHKLVCRLITDRPYHQAIISCHTIMAELWCRFGEQCMPDRA